MRSGRNSQLVNQASGAKPKCLVTAPLTKEGLEKLGRRVEVIYEEWRKGGTVYFGDELTERLNRDGIEIFIEEADQISAENIERTGLKFIGACMGNPYQVDVEAATKKGVPVVNSPGRNTQAVVELTIGLTIALIRKVVYAQKLLARGVVYEGPGDFQRMYNSLEGAEVAGSTVGIVGLGEIGTRVARLFGSFGANVLVCDPYVPDEKVSSIPAKRASLEELMAASDIVSVHVKVSDQTYHIVGERELSLMKPTAVLINTSSSGTVDDEALLKALKERKIAGAALDCQEAEPVDSANPFLTLDNALVTPHIGGNSKETIERQSEMMVEDVIRFLDGQRPLRLMNPEVYSRPTS
jgi:D-3-phosphoglycerate dehydrogenase